MTAAYGAGGGADMGRFTGGGEWRQHETAVETALQWAQRAAQCHSHSTQSRAFRLKKLCQQEFKYGALCFLSLRMLQHVSFLLK